MCPKRPISWGLSLLVMASVVATPSKPFAADDPVVATYARLKPSLALVVAASGTGYSQGTAFCIFSTHNASFYLTNRHVVGDATTVTVVQQFPAVVRMIGTVTARGVLSNDPKTMRDDTDLAVIRVARGDIPAAALRVRATHEGERVAVAGYPASQSDIAQLGFGLQPSLHLGVVSALPDSGRYVEYDAETWHGNSGGPIFDPATGDVIAVVRLGFEHAANLGISVAKLVVPFLNENEVGYHSGGGASQKQALIAAASAPPTPSGRAAQIATSTLAVPAATQPELPPSEARPIPTIPGANRFVLVLPTPSTTTSQQIVSAFGSDLAAKVRQAFSVDVTVTSGSVSTQKDAAQFAKDNDAIATIWPSLSWSTKQGTWAATQVTAKLNVGLVDRFGFLWAVAREQKEANSRHAAVDAVTSSLADLDDLAARELVRVMTVGSSDPTTIANFDRYAVPMATGSKRAFFGLKTEGGHVTVSVAVPFGSAARAGLQKNDEVVSINGQSVATLSQADLQALYTKYTDFDIEVRGADGATSHVRFAQQDIRYYVNLRSDTTEQ